MVNKANLSTHVLVGSIIILVLLVVNLLYARVQRINEPIFFEHYYEETIYENQREYVNIHYITNASETRNLSSIEFPELSYPLVVEHSNVDSGKYYSHHTAWLQVTLSKEDFEKLEKDKIIILESGIARFSGGNEQPINIGKIVLLPRDRNKNSLHCSMSSSSSNQTSTTVYRVDKEITITKVQSELIDDVSSIFRIRIEPDFSSDVTESSINIRDIKLPITVDNTLTIFTEAAPIDKKWVFSRILLKLSYEDIDKQEGIIDLLNMRYEPYLSEKDIREYVRSREE